MNNLRALLWAYLVLLIVEGALRKWIIPALDTPLLIIRDPLVIWIYFVAMQNRYSFQSAFFTPNLWLAVITVLLSTLVGEGNILVTIYGIRTDFLQIPLLFLIPQILNRDDVITMGKFFLLISIPFTALVILQFRSPPDSLWNKGAFMTHYDTVRPSGTFSFITGVVAFYALVTSYLFYGYIQARTYRFWLLATVAITTLAACACSGSRSCIASVGLVAVVATLCVLARGRGGMGILIFAVLVALAVPILSATTFFQNGTSQLSARIDDAAGSEVNEGGFLGRFINTMAGPITTMGEVPFFGEGLGIGTNGGAALLHGDREFIGPEDEWGRLIFESGPIFGFLIIVFRIALTIYIARRAYEAFHRGNILPVLLFAGCGVLILNGQWGVPTTLGFAIFGGGLTLAACEEPAWEEEYDHDENHEHSEDESDHSPAADKAG